MSLAVVLLIAAAAVAYVARPLFANSEPAEPLLVAVGPEIIVAEGVAYTGEEEWAVDRALDKVDGGEPEAGSYERHTQLEEEVERQVAAIRRGQQETRRKAKPVCPGCGRPFQSGESYCARCGAPHPRVCPQCGKRYRQGDAFCTDCGAPLTGGEER